MAYRPHEEHEEARDDRKEGGDEVGAWHAERGEEHVPALREHPRAEDADADAEPRPAEEAHTALLVFEPRGPQPHAADDPKLRQREEGGGPRRGEGEEKEKLQHDHGEAEGAHERVRLAEVSQQEVKLDGAVRELERDGVHHAQWARAARGQRCRATPCGFRRHIFAGRPRLVRLPRERCVKELAPLAAEEGTALGLFRRMRERMAEHEGAAQQKRLEWRSEHRYAWPRASPAHEVTQQREHAGPEGADEQP